VEIIAHRGASFDAPENTLAAIHLAWQQQADAVEIDVQFSKDGQIVVIHDDNTRKTGGVPKKVREQTLAELKRLDVGHWKAAKWAGQSISTLDEVIATIPNGKRLFVEVKCGPECLAEFQKAVCGGGKRRQQIVAIGFALEIMKLIKQKLPDIEVCWIAEFKRNWKTGGWVPRVETLIQKASDAGLDGLDLGAKGPITAGLIKQVKEARLKLYVWTVDSPRTAQRLIDSGVDGITTNRPGWLRQRLLLGR
jgi:glycerophosphoryl diester phosphodiesterase